MGDFYLIKANFLYLDFTSTIEKEIATNLIDKDRHVLVLEELEKILFRYLTDFTLSEIYEMPFIDEDGKDNGYLLRRLAINKVTGLKGKLELMVKRLD
ncbi:hypothetical protein [uncultured Apibacter sp.]|uniref:hypothetical protein n=1 Tax=uncultured Apibacter sp. TaxID=1778616 RepID=UPI0025CE6387|nr:hypothetical protein [uncultured Apibacter sp.]